MEVVGELITWSNPILEGFWEIKDNLAREAGYDAGHFPEQLRLWNAHHPRLAPTAPHALSPEPATSLLEEHTNNAALTEQMVQAIVKANKGKKKLLAFAAAKFMSQKLLPKTGVDFCQLPYAIHRMPGD